jgi:hypothetical protein
MLRQVAVLLERENAKLHAKLHDLAVELARLRGDTPLTAQHELTFLKKHPGSVDTSTSRGCCFTGRFSRSC